MSGRRVSVFSGRRCLSSSLGNECWKPWGRDDSSGGRYSIGDVGAVKDVSSKIGRWCGSFVATRPSSEAELASEDDARDKAGDVDDDDDGESLSRETSCAWVSASEKASLTCGIGASNDGGGGTATEAMVRGREEDRKGEERRSR